LKRALSQCDFSPVIVHTLEGGSRFSRGQVLVEVAGLSKRTRSYRQMHLGQRRTSVSQSRARFRKISANAIFKEAEERIAIGNEKFAIVSRQKFWKQISLLRRENIFTEIRLPLLRQAGIVTDFLLQ